MLTLSWPDLALFKGIFMRTVSTNRVLFYPRDPTVGRLVSIILRLYAKCDTILN